ncbi:MAG: hypothetical protein E4H36_05485 [Spirochaetales bacterium]|nr:MAG: hypothetical protein E4H36_05485 [Spirochaetales bacterium]
MNKILKVNTRTGEIMWQTCSDEDLMRGGRSFIAHHFLKEVDPRCEPLGRSNKLIIAAGLLGDTPVTTAGRLSLGGKSPLTGGIKESNVGGAAGKRMAELGLKAVLLEDAPDSPEPRYLLIRKDHAELKDAPDLRGMETSETLKYLRTRFGDKSGLLCIGPAGEMGLTAACVATTDHKGVQLRVAGRGGLGAVMGVKGIKAVVIDAGAAEPANPADRAALIYQVGDHLPRNRFSFLELTETEIARGQNTQ